MTKTVYVVVHEDDDGFTSCSRDIEAVFGNRFSAEAYIFDRALADEAEGLVIEEWPVHE